VFEAAAVPWVPKTPGPLTVLGPPPQSILRSDLCVDGLTKPGISAEDLEISRVDEMGKKMKQLLLTVTLSCSLLSTPAPADPGKTAHQGSVDQTLMQMERDYSAAYLHHDTATVARMLADDYVGIDGRAVLSDKAEEVEEAKAPPPGSPTPDYLVSDETLSEMKVRVYGDAAIVTGLSTEKVLIKGLATTVRYRRTTIYVKRHTQWQCVSFHATRVRDQP
jgi:ketosteroid isomerase-like protein